jgi:two-component system, LuxR family, sensor kinase FixL
MSATLGDRLTAAHPRSPRLPAYGVSLASVVVALLVTQSLNRPEIRGPLFVPAIMLSAWHGGLGPGLLAAALSVAAIQFFLIPPRASVRVALLDDVLYVAVFAVSALIVAWVTGAQRRSEVALRAAHEDLSSRMEELRLANERLEAEIVDRTHAEAEVYRQASLLDLTHDSVIVRDADDAITYWNRGAEERYQWTRAEAIGRSPHELLGTVFPVPREALEAELLRTGRWEGELVHTKRDGARIVVASRWSLRRDALGRSAGVLETNSDITELQRSQAELARVTRLTMLGEITASIAHEINQPLAAVVMNGNACRRWLDADPPEVGEAREAAGRVVGDGERAGRIIERIRSLARRRMPERSVLDVNDVLREAVAFTRIELERQGVAIETALDDGLPAIRGDRVQLQQVLVNLLLNACDAMGGVSAGARRVDVASRRRAGGEVLVEVADRGRGLEPADAERIFEPFFSTKPNGLGMGLSICRSIVVSHGGRIWAASNDGPGVTMRLTLPAAPGGE